MEQREVRIANRRGLHARAAAQIVRLASQFRSKVTLVYGGQTANARNIMAVMLLAASMHSVIVLETSGPDETEAMAAIVMLIQGGFGERQ